MAVNSNFHSHYCPVSSTMNSIKPFDWRHSWHSTLNDCFHARCSADCATQVTCRRLGYRRKAELGSVRAVARFDAACGADGDDAVIGVPRRARLRFHRLGHRPGHPPVRSIPPHQCHRPLLRFPPHLLLHRPRPPCPSPHTSATIVDVAITACSNAACSVAFIAAIAILAKCAAAVAASASRSFDALLRR